MRQKHFNKTKTKSTGQKPTQLNLQMKHYYAGNEESMQFRMRLKLILLFLLLVLIGTAAQAQCPTPPGNPSVYGEGNWINYVYSGLDTNNPPQNAFSSSMTYRGYSTYSEVYNQNYGDNAVSGANICGSYSDSFAVRSRMHKSFTPGWYNVTIGGDDGIRLSLDGGNSWAISDWNYHSYQTVSAMVYLTADMYLVMDSYDQGGQYQVSFNYNACPSTPSTAPTSISGPTNVCGNTQITLTATGGTTASTGSYQWGTGTVGQNIISGATSATYSPTVTQNTTYWVRRVDTGVCAQTTAAATLAVIFTNASSAPQWISGTNSICQGASTTLTANGGTHVSGSVYEWGTGSTPGQNVLSGQTGQNITVTPSATTTYWVRRVNANNCGNTSAVFYNVVVNAPPGDPSVYPYGSWNGYVYASFNNAPPADAFTQPYRGFVTQQLVFDQNLGGGAISGPNVCGSYSDRFAVRFRAQQYINGTLTFTVGGDDGYRFSIDGGQTWLIDNWGEHSYATTTSTTQTLSGTYNLVLEYYENGGDSRVSFNYTQCSATAPTSLSGSTCSENGVNLTATGGNGNRYQWGTGNTAGNNVFDNNGYNQTVWVNPSTTTTYWVRRWDETCNYYTSAVFTTVYKKSVAPTGITGPNNNKVCSGTNFTLTANGGTLATGAAYEWGTGSVGSNVIAGATSATLTRSQTANTTYWVRIKDQAACGNTNHQSITINLFNSASDPTSITASNACSPDGTNLTANGGSTGDNSEYQWGTGTNIGQNIIGGNGQTIWVTPSNTTTYWVRRRNIDCNTFTGGTTITVYKGSAGPWSINTSQWQVCPGSSVTLTADGTLGGGASYQWGTGNTAGQNIIAGATGSSVSVSPTTNTVYWVRFINAGSCPAGSPVYFTQNVYTRSSAPTSISGNATLCSGQSQNLTAQGVTFGNAGGQYQWGTGSTVGTNPIANSNSQSLNVQPTVPTTYWVRAYDSTCNYYSAGVTFTVNTGSTAPTGVSGTTTICSGSNTTLTATGGYTATFGAFEWGTGGNAGQNIISGQTSASITVSPTTTTQYWVRRKDGSPCNTTTNAQFVTVTVTDPSVGPTSISGTTTTCPGTSTTLTATGGNGSNTFQWGTGSVGSNIISGQTGASITVSPSATTTYWVRRVDAAPCATTSAATGTITVNAAPGDPSVFGNNVWNVYAYNGNDFNLSPSNVVYRGYYVQENLNPNTQNTSDHGWNNNTSPSSSDNWQGCSVNIDQITYVYKRKGFTCGNYDINMVRWDDAAQVYINGNLVWSCNAYSGGNTCGTNVGNYNLDGTSEIEIRVRENGGATHMAMNLTRTDVSSTNMSSLTASSNSVCAGTEITLTANGGVQGTNGVYQWGTGAVGSNILGTTQTNTFNVTPMAATTYWVRFYDNLCGTATDGRTRNITMSTPVAAGLLSSGVTTLCRNAVPTSGITLSGHTGSVVKWQYADDSAFTANVTDINVTTTTLSAAQIGNVPATRYFRAVVANGCGSANTTPVVITVPAAVIYSNGAWSGTPTANTPVIINSDLTLSSNLSVCACQVSNGATLTIESYATLIATREVNVDAGSSLIVENSGSIVQIDDDASNLGIVRVKRKTAAMKNFDFTYWSAPVQGFTLKMLSPNTLSDKYYKFNPDINNWASIANGNEVMEAGKGYIVRAPQGWSLTNATSGVYNAEFIGVPNTGIIPVTIKKSASAYNLIGNPYPSAIDIDRFLTDAVNQGVVNGTVYLWSHNTPLNPAGGVYTYTTNDYAKYNLTGGVKTSNSAITGGQQPTGKIASGQGFFIEAATASAAGSTNTAYFRNNMRVAGMNNQFYSDDQPTTGLEKHRVWVNITSATGAYDETLVGYIENATQGFDPLFDGTTFPAGNAVSIYSLLEDKKIAIQGRSLPFDNQDIVPLGYRTNVAGEFTIALEQFDGLFGDQDVFLYDKTAQTYHNLKNGGFTFTSVTGTFEDRFELRYVDTTLGTIDHEKANSVIVIKKDDHIEISSGAINMKTVTLYDITGKRIMQATDINNTLFTSNDLNIPTQVLIVKIQLENDTTISRKVRF